jgi:hypothetical protein
VLCTLRQAMPHSKNPRLGSYPLWSEEVGVEPVPEETEEIVLASKPVALTKLLAASPKAPALKGSRRAQHI